MTPGSDLRLKRREKEKRAETNQWEGPKEEEKKEKSVGP